MSEGAIQIEETGAEQAAAHLAQMGERASDVRPAHALLQPVFAVDESRRFAVEGPGWAQLSEDTQRIKAANGMDASILRATGALYDSLTRMAGVSEGRRDALAFGTDVPYARFHQHGTRFMPKREPVGLSQSARQEMTQLLTTYIAEPER